MPPKRGQASTRKSASTRSSSKNVDTSNGDSVNKASDSPAARDKDEGDKLSKLDSKNSDRIENDKLNGEKHSRASDNRSSPKIKSSCEKKIDDDKSKKDHNNSLPKFKSSVEKRDDKKDDRKSKSSVDRDPSSRKISPSEKKDNDKTQRDSKKSVASPERSSSPKRKERKETKEKEKDKEVKEKDKEGDKEKHGEDKKSKTEDDHKRKSSLSCNSRNSTDRSKSPSPAFKKFRRNSPGFARGFGRGRPFGMRRGGFMNRMHRMGGRTNPTLVRRLDLERIRRREKERDIQEAERRKHELLRTQREIERKAREGIERLERAKEKLREERERLEKEKSDLLRLQREKNRNDRDKKSHDRDESRRDRFKVHHKGGYDNLKLRSSIADKKRFDNKDISDPRSMMDSRKLLTHRVGPSTFSTRSHDVDIGARLPRFDLNSNRTGNYDSRAADGGFRRYTDVRRPPIRGLVDRDYRRGPMNDDGGTRGSGYYGGSASRIDGQSRDERAGASRSDDWNSIGNRKRGGQEKRADCFSTGYGYTGEDRGGRVMTGNHSYSWYLAS